MLLCVLCLLFAVLVPAAVRMPDVSSHRPPSDSKRVYLIHADELRYDQNRNDGAQVLTGSVEFEHEGAHLFCDSANYFQESNSFEAWGNVRMVQGDTLSLTSDYGYYDGNAMLMEAKVFSSTKQVVLKNRTTYLYTDTLYYDRNVHTGYYDEGGKLVDETSTLTSVHGEYHTDTKDAFFNDNVKMVDKDFTLTTNDLEYNTRTTLAHIIGPSDIYSGDSHIYSEMGYYNSTTGKADLLNRSRVDNKQRTLVGDSIHYEENTGVSEAFGNVVAEDNENKSVLYCNYGFYNDSTGYAMCTDSAMIVDCSEEDSLYVHGDTIKMFTFHHETDSAYRVVHIYNKVRAYRVDLQGVCDSLVYNEQDSCVTMYYDPILWNNNQQLVGEVIKVFMKDSVVDRAHVINQAFSIEDLKEKDMYNQVSSKEMFAFFTDGEMHEAQAVDNVLVVYYPVDDADSSYVGMVYMETSKLTMFMNGQQMERIWTPKAEGTMYPLTQVPPGKNFLEGFAWFDDVRPQSKEDIFVWRPKRAGTELKKQKRRTPPAYEKTTTVQP